MKWADMEEEGSDVEDQLRQWETPPSSPQYQGDQFGADFFFDHALVKNRAPPQLLFDHALVEDDEAESLSSGYELDPGEFARSTTASTSATGTSAASAATTASSVAFGGAEEDRVSHREDNRAQIKKWAKAAGVVVTSSSTYEHFHEQLHREEGFTAMPEDLPTYRSSVVPDTYSLALKSQGLATVGATHQGRAFHRPGQAPQGAAYQQNAAPHNMKMLALPPQAEAVKDDNSTPRTQTTQADSSLKSDDFDTALLLHQQGQCKPCLFVHTPIGCDNGDDCAFCHFPHSRKKGRRPCKSKRERFHKLVLWRTEMQQDEVQSGDPSTVQVEQQFGGVEQQAATGGQGEGFRLGSRFEG